jgi:hypothetical protein
MWRYYRDKGAHPDFQMWEARHYPGVVILSEAKDLQFVGEDHEIRQRATKGSEPCDPRQRRVCLDGKSRPKEANPPERANGAIARTASSPAGRSMPS